LRVIERCTETGKRIARYWTPTQGASLIAILRSEEMAKLNLIFGRTEHDNVANSWLGIKVIPVEVPDELLLQCDHFSWELIGGEWEHRTARFAEDGLASKSERNTRTRMSGRRKYESH
jgi:hypothetical protein